MNDTTESFLRMEAIFYEAQDAPEHLRPGLIEYRANGDAAMVSEIWSLLKACDEADRVTASRRIDVETGRERGAAPRRIGPYLLDRVLGRGGMGAVYLAHRADGQFEQDVAIKLIDLPLATDIFRERFRQERQILAGLQHPYIARLLDGGVTDNGDPYLVMEYVAGQPIHRFCDERKVPLRQRIELFLRVCEAVQFAHQNLVVHRDLKPDNIFVVDDATPRLLDFGTAKLLSPAVGAPGTEFTREGYHSFTPQYASPEQVLGNPITTASDTYSLGVLLYLLLTQTLPYELKEMTTAEMLRVVCEHPPRKPAGAILSSKRENTDRFDPGHVDEDLEAIVMKALRKEPQERYLTADQFASDIRAWLDGQPVAARRGTFRYRAQKFIRRHRLGFVGAALLALTLVAGIAGVLWQARLANQERRKADARSADLRQLSNSLLSELNEAIKDLPGSTGVQKLLVTRVLEHLDRMAADAQGDRPTQLDVADAYTRLGNIQGNPYEQNLGDAAGALVSFNKAISLVEPLVRANAQDRDALRALAVAQEDRGEVLSEISSPQDTVASLQSAVATYHQLNALPGAVAATIADESRANDVLGDETGEDIGLADVHGAMVDYRKSMDLDRRALQVDPDYQIARRGLTDMQFKIGNVELDFDPAQALTDLRIAQQSMDALPEPERSKLSMQRRRALTVRKIAVAQTELGEFAAAQPLFAEALREFERVAAAGNAQAKDIRALSDVKRILFDMGLSEEDASDPALGEAPVDRHRFLLAAEQTWQHAIATIEQIRKQDVEHDTWQDELASAQVHLAKTRIALGELHETDPLMRNALAVLNTFAHREHASSRLLDLYVNGVLSDPAALAKESAFAIACAEREVELNHRKDTASLLALARVYRAVGQIEKSVAAAKEGLALLTPPRPGAKKEIMRTLLEIQAQT